MVIKLFFPRFCIARAHLDSLTPQTDYSFGSSVYRNGRYRF